LQYINRYRGFAGFIIQICSPFGPADAAKLSHILLVKIQGFPDVFQIPVSHYTLLYNANKENFCEKKILNCQTTCLCLSKI
jgi:hypothetical protein